MKELGLRIRQFETCRALTTASLPLQWTHAIHTTSLILTKAPWDRCYYFPHFVKVETEARSTKWHCGLEAGVCGFEPVFWLPQQTAHLPPQPQVNNEEHVKESSLCSYVIYKRSWNSSKKNVGRTLEVPSWLSIRKTQPSSGKRKVFPWSPAAFDINLPKNQRGRYNQSFSGNVDWDSEFWLLIGKNKNTALCTHAENNSKVGLS